MTLDQIAVRINALGFALFAWLAVDGVIDAIYARQSPAAQTAPQQMAQAQPDETDATEPMAQAQPEAEAEAGDATDGDGASEMAAPEEAPAETDQTETAPTETADASAAMAGDPEAGAAIWRQCQACHVADAPQNRVGPHLVDVVGRQIASVEGFRYSDALAGREGAWTRAELDAWLKDPQAYAPGTIMAYSGLDSAEDRADLIAWLAGK